MEKERTLDCRGMSCPQPVIRTKEALEELAQGWLRVVLDNEASCTNVRRFAEGLGHLVREERSQGLYQVRIRKGAGASAADPTPVVCETPEKRQVVVYVASEGIGRGDEALGKKLMAAYLDTLAQFAKDISHVVLINAGVKLAVEGSPVLEQIQEMERMGARVLSCGTCLNHFGVADRLRVGSVSNMLAILEVLSGAGKVMSL